MNITRKSILLLGAQSLLALFALSILLAVHAQGTTAGRPFLYHGRFESGGGPASGRFDLAFSLFDTPAGGAALAGPLTNSAVPVHNGRFAVTLDFGAGPFTATNYWMDIRFRPAGSNTFTEISPRRALRPSPYAGHGQGLRTTHVIIPPAGKP